MQLSVKKQIIFNYKGWCKAKFAKITILNSNLGFLSAFV